MTDIQQQQQSLSEENQQQPILVHRIRFRQATIMEWIKLGILVFALALIFFISYLAIKST